MPYYDFSCEACQTLTEKRMSFAEHKKLATVDTKPFIPCPACGKAAVQKIAPAAMQMNYPRGERH